MRYELIRSSRKSISVSVKEGRVIVRAPYRASRAFIESFLREHEAWIEDKLLEQERVVSEAEEAGLLTSEDIKALAGEAKRVIPERVAYYASLVGVTYGTITIRSQKTKWGSCTASGNLSFNCLLMLAPIEVLDSVIVHELCHRKQLNHSRLFYDEVLRVFPDYKACHRWLKENGPLLIKRMTG